MTDQERADYFIDLRAAADLATDAHADELRRDLAEEFAAVRVDERRACIAVVEEVRWCYVSKGIHTILHIVGERLRLRGEVTP
jgi:hypothetical protein